MNIIEKAIALSDQMAEERLLEITQRKLKGEISSQKQERLAFELGEKTMKKAFLFLLLGDRIKSIS